MKEPEFSVHTVPVLDTGFGREAGYANDAELVAAGEAERAKLSPEVRAAVEKLDAELDRRILGL